MGFEPIGSLTARKIEIVTDSIVTFNAEYGNASCVGALLVALLTSIHNTRMVIRDQRRDGAQTVKRILKTWFVLLLIAEILLIVDVIRSPIGPPYSVANASVQKAFVRF